MVVRRQRDLLKVVLALRAGSGLTDLLYGGQEQADQDRDDRDHDQQLNQGERHPPAYSGKPKHKMHSGSEEDSRTLVNQFGR